MWGFRDWRNWVIKESHRRAMRLPFPAKASSSICQRPKTTHLHCPCRFAHRISLIPGEEYMSTCRCPFRRRYSIVLKSFLSKVILLLNSSLEVPGRSARIAQGRHEQSTYLAYASKCFLASFIWLATRFKFLNGNHTYSRLLSTCSQALPIKRENLSLKSWQSRHFLSSLYIKYLWVRMFRQKEENNEWCADIKCCRGVSSRWGIR